MRTVLAEAPASARPGPRTTQAQGGGLLSSPSVLAYFDLLITVPSKVLTFNFLAFLICFSIQTRYARLKSAPLHLELAHDRLHHAARALWEDFRDEGIPAVYDGIIIWCDGCKLQERPSFDQALMAVDAELRDLKAHLPACSGLSWQSVRSGTSENASRTLMADDGTASIVLLARSARLELGQAYDCVLALHGRLSRDVDGRFGGLRVELGTPLAVAMLTASEELRNVVRHIGISAPLLSLLLWLFVGGVFRALTPLLCLACSVVGTRAVIVVVKLVWGGFNFSQPDAVVTFVMLALALDYAVVFWARFRQERAKRPDHEDLQSCLLVTLRATGLVVLASVAVLEVGFLGLNFYPDVNRTGVLATNLQLMVSTALVAFHSLTLPAALTAYFPQTFDEARKTRNQPPSGPTAAQKFFVWFSGLATRPPWVVLLPLIAYALMVPLLAQLRHYRPNYDLIDAMLSPDLSGYDAYGVYRARFPGKRATPVMVVLEATPLGGGWLPTRPNDMLLRQGGPGLPGRGSAQLQALAWESAALAPAGLGDVALHRAAARGAQLASASRGGLRARQSGPSGGWAPQQHQPQGFDFVSLTPQFRGLVCRFARKVVKRTANKSYEVRPTDIDAIWWDPEKGECSDRPRLLDSPISWDGRKQVLSIYPAAEPLGWGAQQLTTLLWDEIEPVVDRKIDFGGELYRFQAQHVSIMAQVMLADGRMAARAPWIILGTVLGVCGVVGWIFRSMGVGLKVLVSVVLPILADYGLLVAAWQRGWLEWAGISPHGGGVLCGMMYTTFGFLLGLAIDYDVVLFARVYERRMEGYDNTSAVRMGLIETGPMVTLAGTLMTLSFLIMCFDELLVVRQLATLYCFGVALDTYVVRTCIAPTVLCLAGRLNYWPGSTPPESKAFNPQAQDGPCCHAL